MKYFIFSFPFSGNKAKCGVEFRQLTRNATEMRRKVGNENSDSFGLPCYMRHKSKIYIQHQFYVFQARRGNLVSLPQVWIEHATDTVATGPWWTQNLYIIMKLVTDRCIYIKINLLLEACVSNRIQNRNERKSYKITVLFNWI